MTEDEAKTKLCCQFEGKCAGSACMAWRWSIVTNKHGDRVRSDETDMRIGYCGLAGKP